MNAYNKEWLKKREIADSGYGERRRQKHKEWMKMKLLDKDYRIRLLAQRRAQRERERNDPVAVEARRIYMHEWWKRKRQDPAFQELDRKKRKEYYRKKRHADPDFIRKRNKETRRKVLDHYGNKCACCGEKEPDFLTIDHINGDGWEHRRREPSAAKGMYQWLLSHKYPDGFQLLCYNCNCAKGHYGVCPHQREKQQ